MAHRKTIDEYDVNSDDQMIYNTSITVDAGLTVNSLSVNQNGTLYITDGATANKTTVNENGTMLVYDGGTANDTSVNALGEAIIENGGSANNTAMNGGTLLVNSGGIADKTTLSGVWSDFEGMKLLDTAQMTVSAGGIAKNTTVNQWSCLDIEYGGIAKNVTVALGGEVYISEGGTLSGKLNISNGTVQADNGAFIDFTVADHQVDGDYLINDLSLIKGTPVYTITVNNNQKDGIYKLAQGAENFMENIFIKNESGTLGTISANGESVTCNFVQYTLKQQNGSMTFAVVDISPIDAPTFTVSPANSWTNGNVVITAVFDKISVANEYSLDGGINWKSCSGNTITVSSNGTVQLRSKNSQGIYSSVTTVNINNIDKTAPTLTITSSNASSKSVTITASAVDSASGIKLTQYSLDNKTWINGNSFTANKNGTIWFKTIDNAGNVKTASYEVTTIVTNNNAPKNIKAVVSKYNLTISWDKLVAAKGQKVTYYVTVDGKDYKSTSNKFKLSKLAPGSHEYKVRGVITEKGKADVYTEWSNAASFSVADITIPKMGKVKASQLDADSVSVT